MKKLIYTLGLVMITSMIFWSCQKDEVFSDPESGFNLKSAVNCGACLEKWTDSKENILADAANDLYIEASNDGVNLYLRVYRLNKNSNLTRIENLTVKQNGSQIYGPYDSPVGVGNVNEIIIPAIKLSSPWAKCDKITLSLTAKGVGKGGGKVISDLEYNLREIATNTTLISSPESPVCIGEPVTLTAEVTSAEVISDGSILIMEGNNVVASGSVNEPLTFTYTTTAATRSFTAVYDRVSGYCESNDAITVETKECAVNAGPVCEESFSYAKNSDGSYTFTYIPAEDFVNANVVFTFAQGVNVAGLEGWLANGSTRQLKMDLTACEVYSWTVTLTPDCSGSQAKSNVWTDFKVVPAGMEEAADDFSKKGDLDNIEMICPENSHGSNQVGNNGKNK